jgi:hypothetical protein
MGTPVKLILRGQPVFVCCAACAGQAEKYPDKALARAEQLRSQTVSLARSRSRLDG